MQEIQAGQLQAATIYMLDCWNAALYHPCGIPG